MTAPDSDIARLRQAVAANPRDIRSRLEMARRLLQTDRLPEAGLALQALIGELRPQQVPLAQIVVNREPLAEAMALAGRLRVREGNLASALAFFQDAVDLAGRPYAKIQFATTFSRLRFTRRAPELEKMVATALEEAWILPSLLMPATASFLLCDPAYINWERRLAAGLPHGSQHAPWSDGFAKIAADPLLCVMLRFAIISDAGLEELLIALRRQLLMGAIASSSPPPQPEWTRFCAALACQCHANGYAFAWTDDEKRAADTLVERLADTPEDLLQQRACEIALAGAYRPLATLPFADRLLAHSWPEPMEELVTRQIREPRREQALRQSLPRSGNIAGAVTEAVKQQYEESPYPSWLRLPITGEQNRLDDMLCAIAPEHVPGSVAQPKTILVAGCGTGQESVSLARQFPEADVLALDLSLASLGYAQRKAEEYGAANLRHEQGDLLTLGERSRTFDLVVCGGVLHYLERPFDGLKILAEITNPGGHLMLALYSRLGRQDLEPISAFARARGYAPTPESLRAFRRDVLALPTGDVVRTNALSREDFFSLAMLRDMVFHANEHRLDIPQIADAIDRLGLSFRGFLLEEDVRRGFHARFGPAADRLSLSQWARFEEENPATFSTMYHFVLEKR